ncbi:DNA-binding response regulator CreB [Yersinia intermedia]|uniref:winged helix-turn-helix domain-containing protein n=1 Tax=Yersinia intermedia TaxID=631 RepID=UPI0005E69AD8|nr:winged helix-turn-helix domain-containing protein [Yersinia intermedia]CND13624.1 DNA-binding response regulator CreB [Yersinia intermedia]CNH38988.1 DNA-binding response regulator CreB [Yersinia intermedia]
MKYLIDNNVLFNPEKKIISSNERPEIVISLTTTASRLLTQLVLNPGEMLSRAYLLKVVWEDNGYSSSDASLNNNISLLRKNFLTVNGDEVELKTIPKMGFQLNAKVEILHESNDLEIDENHEERLEEDKKTRPCIFRSGERKYIQVIFLTTIVIVVVTVMVFLFQKQRNFQFSTKETTRAEQLGQCDVYSLAKTGTDFNAVLDKYPFLKEKCAEQKASIYYDFSDLTKDRAKNLFVAICYHSNSSGYHKCENIKSYSLQ